MKRFPFLPISRPYQIAAILAAMVGLSLYGRYHNPWLSLEECLKDPERFDGCIVNEFHEPRIQTVHSDGFTLMQKDGPSIRVVGPMTGLKIGEYVGLEAVFHKEGYLEAVKFRTARNRRAKMAFSLIPTVLVLFWLARDFRLRRHPLAIERRTHA